MVAGVPAATSPWDPAVATASGPAGPSRLARAADLASPSIGLLSDAVPSSPPCPPLGRIRLLSDAAPSSPPCPTPRLLAPPVPRSAVSGCYPPLPFHVRFPPLRAPLCLTPTGPLCGLNPTILPAPVTPHPPPLPLCPVKPPLPAPLRVCAGKGWGGEEKVERRSSTARAYHTQRARGGEGGGGCNLARRDGEGRRMVGGGEGRTEALEYPSDLTIENHMQIDFQTQR